MRRVSDLQYICEQGQFFEYGISEKLEVRRLWDMLSGHKEAKEHFKYLSKHGIRGIAQIFISDSKLLDQMVDLIPDNVLTGYHLKDIFDTTKKISEIKQKLYDVVLFNKRFPKSLEISKTISPESEDKPEKE